MDPRSPSFEANLLYKTAQHPDIDLLVEDIRDALEEQSVILLYAEKVDGVFTLLTCDTMQILLAFTDVAIPVEHFLDAQRPAAAAISETEMLGKLTAHRSNVTVMVVDHEFDGPPPSQWHDIQKRTICWEIAACISHYAAPEIVFWCDTGTLYAYDKFERACTFNHSRATECAATSPPVQIAPRHFVSEPMITQATMDWIDHQMDEAREVSEPDREPAEALTMETVMTVSLPAILAKQLSRIRGTERSYRGLRTAAMVCVAAAICFGGLSTAPTLFY